MQKHYSMPSAASSSDQPIRKKESVEEDEVKSSKILDAKGIAEFFLGFWTASDACDSLNYLDNLERKSNVRRLQKLYGRWSPPPELNEMLKKPQTQNTDFSPLPDNKDTRNLKYVLKMLGCSVHENRPYKHFLKAQTHRQMKLWLYRYQGARYHWKKDYREPICPTRLKRLYHFFPERFSLEDDSVCFNSQLLTYDHVNRVFYIGYVPSDDESE